MTTPDSPSRSVPYRDGAFLKDLDQLKSLIQQTMEEYAACGSHDQLTSREKDNSKENISNSEDLVEDFRKDVVEIAQLAEGRRVASADEAGKVNHYYIASTFVRNCLLFWIASLSQLRQVIDDNHRRRLELIPDTFQSRLPTIMEIFLH